MPNHGCVPWQWECKHWIRLYPACQETGSKLEGEKICHMGHGAKWYFP